MRPTYFAAGNLWLLVSLLLALGRTFERSEPLMYSFFGIGDWYYPSTYNVWVGLSLAAAAVCFLLWLFGPTGEGRMAEARTR